MLSTYKKWLKRELVKKGYWTIGVQTLGKREFEAFFRLFAKTTYSEYGFTIKRGLRNIESARELLASLVDETGFYSISPKFLGTKKNFGHKLVTAIRLAQDK